MREFYQEARARGLKWPDVIAVYRELKQTERDRREYPNAIRSTAWMIATASTPGSWPFWRHGFASRWGRKVAEGDHTLVPGYDEIAQQIATAFPEYAGDDGTERLFDFLFSPYDRLPSRAEMLRKALDLAEHWLNTGDDEPTKNENLEPLEF